MHSVKDEAARWRNRIGTFKARAHTLLAVIALAGCSSRDAAQTSPGASGNRSGGADPVPVAGSGGATMVKPVALSVTGADCSDNGSGSVAAFFPPHTLKSTVGFNIGPIPGVDLPHSAPYKGPGTYQGAIVVNADRQTGTFATDDGKASGTWDCGTPLR
jgi:hypothetical protein